VNRDLKPQNILVTKDGVPKLLDFGIAKILHTQDPQELNTVTLLPLMTPDYASPEQIRGDAITTASDVYSLGVILYVLLTARHPHRTKGTAPHELIRAICEVDPERPSMTAERHGLSDAKSTNSSAAVESPALEVKRRRRALAGDLDNIVLKALRKEPERRYATVEQFSEDIRRYLMGLPVMAHKDSSTYRARKFIARHKLAVAAAVLLVLSLVGGMITTLWQARVAKYERARAERRFNDVRALANSLMFDVHDSIRDLPGATAARKLIIQRAQQYLDGLAQESNRDPSLLRELAAAYEKLADVQGNGFDANVGDTAGALRNYQKAADLLQACALLEPSDGDTRRRLAQSYISLSMEHLQAGDKERAQQSMQAASLRDSLQTFPCNLHSGKPICGRECSSGIKTN
jgi:non-specific serine/threonine protein kinase/serine/threonine-protein kinase